MLHDFNCTSSTVYCQINSKLLNFLELLTIVIFMQGIIGINYCNFLIYMHKIVIFYSQVLHKL